MGVRRRRSDRSGRGALHSPGRPSVARREDRRRFWMAIAAGRSSEEAAVVAGASPAVGVRWFRQAGGLPPSHLSPSSTPMSDRYLSFTEREERKRRLGGTLRTGCDRLSASVTALQLHDPRGARLLDG